jgi:hypothetical protein
VWGAAQFVPSGGGLGVLVWPTLGLFVLVFGGVGMCLVVAGLWMLGNSLQVRVSGDRIATVRRYLGVPCKRREIPIVDVDRIELTIEGQTGQGGKADVSYRMDAIVEAGGTVRVGDGIRGTPAAERLAALVEDATGLRPKIVVRERRRRRGARDAA